MNTQEMLREIGLLVSRNETRCKDDLYHGMVDRHMNTAVWMLLMDIRKMVSFEEALAVREEMEASE